MAVRCLLCAGLLMGAVLSAARAQSWPAADWQDVDPQTAGLAAEKLAAARDYAASAGGSGCIIYRGRRVMRWGDPEKLYDLKSTSKSIGVTLLGVALQDGKVRLDDPAQKHHPTLGLPPESNAASGWLPRITLRMLADQTAGFDKPGGYVPLLFEPGTRWSYSDSGPNWLAECLTLVYQRDLNDVIFQRVFAPLGIRPADIRWRQNAFRPHLIGELPRREFGSGFSARVDALARLGYLYLREGWWDGRQILPPAFVQALRKPNPALAGLETQRPEQYGKASAHYSLLWWNNGDGTLRGVPRDAFWSWGLYDSLIVVIPSLDLIAARAGQSWPRKPEAAHYAVLAPFLEPLAAAAAGQAAAGAPYPPSHVIRQVVWDPPETIIRRARGSDTWPLTWTDDDALLTAYGDGNGFEPYLPRKLSLGLARVTGMPPDFQGRNLSPSPVEARGDGRQGRKASGMLMVDGVLYLLVRNVDNSQLAWSADRGATWTWCDWKFSTSFGCPAFLNFGRNYGGARDGLVYVYSHDADSAYRRADRFVLARVPKDRVRERAAYEFFVQLDGNQQPVWSTDIDKRGAIFESPGNCYRSQMTYNARLRRYLWCQTGGGNDTRFAGGLGIYDAPEPWGPWTTAYFTAAWDVGPGETSSLPTKWISADGRTVYLVFSGDDSFAVRRATLQVDDAPPARTLRTNSATLPSSAPADRPGGR